MKSDVFIYVFVTKEKENTNRNTAMSYSKIIEFEVHILFNACVKRLWTTLVSLQCNNAIHWPYIKIVQTCISFFNFLLSIPLFVLFCDVSMGCYSRGLGLLRWFGFWTKHKIYTTSTIFVFTRSVGFKILIDENSLQLSNAHYYNPLNYLALNKSNNTNDSTQDTKRKPLIDEA